MKKITLAFILPFFIMCNSNNKKEVSYIDLPKNAKTDINKTDILFEKKVKTIELKNEQKDTSISFTFENIGSHPLLISKAISSCGCTVTSYPKDTIFPNEKNEITLRFTPKSNTSEELKIQQNSVDIFGNFLDSLVSLKIIAKIEPK